MDQSEPRPHEWKEQTTALDRVVAVATSLQGPEPASRIASHAQVAENTARNHLDRLDELGVLRTTDQDGATVYAPDPLYTRFQTIRDLLDTNDRNELISLKADLQEQIQTWQTTFEVESTDALRKRAPDSDTASRTREIREAIRDWELVEYRLSIVDEAIEHYNEYTRHTPR